MVIKTIIFAAMAIAMVAGDYQIPSDKVQQIRDMLKEQCKRNSGEDKSTEVETAGRNFVNCIKELINIDTIKREIEDAKPNGALDEVFKKYCAKSPQLKTCINNLLDGVAPCVDNAAKEHITTAKNATDQLIDFVCYKDGDRIALFIAEGGPECFQSKVNDIKQCADDLKSTITTVEQARNMTMQERCEKFDELQTCIVQKLETCDTPTPANMFESLAKYVRNTSPCPKKKED